MKRILSASLLAMMVTPAVADTPQAVTDAISTIKDAYATISGGDEGVSTDVETAFTGLLHQVDTHGSVKSVTQYNAMDISCDLGGCQIEDGLELRLTLHDNTDGIADAILDVKNNISEDIYGADTAAIAADGFSLISYDTDSEDYTVDAADGALIKQTLDTFAASINKVIDAGGAATTDDVEDVEDSAAEVKSHLEESRDAIAATTDFIASDDYRIRASTDDNVNYPLGTAVTFWVVNGTEPADRLTDVVDIDTDVDVANASIDSDGFVNAEGEKYIFRTHKVASDSIYSDVAATLTN